MDLGLNGKVVLVSGGAGEPGAIGESIVRSVAREGGIPVIVDKQERGEALRRDLGTEGMFVQADLTKPADCERAVRQTLRKFGRINAVVNNLGVNDNVGLEASYEEFLASLHLNLIHMFLLVKYSANSLKEQAGSILNIGSKVAVTGQGNTSAYAAAKGGAMALSREWAVDLVEWGVRSNTLMISEAWTPGYDAWAATLPDGDTVIEKVKARVPLGSRMTRPQEVADLAIFLISDRAGHITGQHIFVDGGYRHLDRALGDIQHTKTSE